MTDIFEGLLKQFQSVLDVSTVLPVFGVKGMLWVFIILEIATYLYLISTSRVWEDATGKHIGSMRRIYWMKFLLLFLVIRPLMMGAGGGRFGAFVLNEMINVALIVMMFFRVRYTRAESGRFESWTDLDSYETDRSKR